MRKQTRMMLTVLWGCLLMSVPLLMGGRFEKPADTRAALPPLYPEKLEREPGIPSPYESGGAEYLTAVTGDGLWTVMPVTVENGDTMDYARGLWGKGMQLLVDGDDFPALAATGLHSRDELCATRTITGRPVGEITRLGRPGVISLAGFLAPGEDIIGVLLADNRTVAALGLTHTELARPLYHLRNVTFSRMEIFQRERRTLDLDRLLYNGRLVDIVITGSKGWQESLFDDEILGMFQFEISRPLEPAERAFLEERYGSLGVEGLEALIRRLSYLHTGEMVPYYIQRYGFYEGHTSYRADPVAIAFIFGLSSLEQIEAAFPGRLAEVLAAGAPAGR